MEISYAMDNMNRLSGASTWKTVNGNVKSIKCYSTVANTKESEINSRIMTNQIDRVSTNVTYSKAHLLEFYKFLTRNSDACSSRTTPKPRPPSPTPRPNITFHTYKCPPAYAAWYCLNEATCFTVKIGDSLLYNCECADGYMGPRCEYKDLDGSYLPTRPRVMLETASIASGAIGSLVLIIIGWCCWCIRRHQQRKLDGKEHNVDTVDSPGIVHVIHSERLLRPFGTHHLKTIPMSDSFK
ncbi:uncharacterized protein LOC128309708 isoform X2 [Anopheles moucheti]|uniref:uncharacterized protein LOC128309708 isoform X2 n=1 Tax=Anopheles moucheti TaxID=186751 RepID=UPI0022EFE5BB|nr:uncharacterized protein LOC128309708 isoform X2 [Anopheles moucheti]